MGRWCNTILILHSGFRRNFPAYVTSYVQYAYKYNTVRIEHYYAIVLQGKNAHKCKEEKIWPVFTSVSLHL